MKPFVILTELLGLILLAMEFGLMLNNNNTDFHIFGYLGAIFLVAGSLAWNKLNKKE